MLSNSVRTLKGHQGAVHVVKYNSNGQYCLSGGQDRIITLWNPNSGGKIKTYEAHGMD
jgi:mitogen-activated protein kinase organizer 1